MAKENINQEPEVKFYKSGKKAVLTPEDEMFNDFMRTSKAVYLKFQRQVFREASHAATVVYTAMGVVGVKWGYALAATAKAVSSPAHDSFSKMLEAGAYGTGVVLLAGGTVALTAAAHSAYKKAKDHKLKEKFLAGMEKAKGTPVGERLVKFHNDAKQAIKNKIYEHTAEGSDFTYTRDGENYRYANTTIRTEDGQEKTVRQAPKVLKQAKEDTIRFTQNMINRFKKQGGK